MKLFSLLALLIVVLFSAPAFAQGRAGSDSPEQQAFDEGMKALNNDDFATAEKKFLDAIQINPKLTDAYWRVAAIRYRNKQYGSAVRLLRRCPDQDNLDVREQLGLNLYKTSVPPPPDAIALLEDVAKKRPESFAVQLQLGQHFLRTDPKRAAAAFEAYFKSRPPTAADLDRSIHLLLGTAYVYAHDWDSAQREFESLLKQKPNDMTYKLMLGAAYVGKSACSQAITLYEKILGEAPRQPSIYYNLGSCYLQVHRVTESQREAELYTRSKPMDSKGYVLVGETFYEQHNWQRALMSFQQAERLDMLSGAIKARIGKTYLAMRNYNAAKVVLEQAAAALPSDWEVQGALAEVYAATGASRDKLNAIADRLAAQTHDPKALFSAGIAYYAAGNDERAERVYEDVLTIEPNAGAAKTNLAKVFNREAGAALGRNQYGHAEGLLRQAAGLVPGDVMTGRNLGLVLLLGKRYPEAASEIEHTLRKVPNDMVLNRLLARAELGEHKLGPAITSYERAAQSALRTRGPELAAIYAELGPLYLEQGHADQAVTVLEQALKEAGSGAAGPVAQRNLAIAYFRRGLMRLQDPKQTDGALDDFSQAALMPKGTLSTHEAAAVSCGEGLAALKANKIQQAETAFAQVGRGGCPLKAPYDRLGVAFLAAYANYRDTQNLQRRETSLKVFAQLAARSSGATAEWLHELLRSDYALLAYDYYQHSDVRRAGTLLKSALRVAVHNGDRRNLDNNVAALELSAGHSAQAEKAFVQLAGKPPESLVNLGILRDRQGEARKALDLYKKAAERGAHAPKLKEWIDVKERLFGAAS